MNARLTVAAGAVVLFWAGLAYNASRPPDYQNHQRTMHQVAATAHDAAQTGRLTGEQMLTGHVTAPYARTAFADATEALAGARKKFTGQTPPDERSRQLRDQVGPLLARETTVLSDTAGANDDTALRDGVQGLNALAGQLDDFITPHR